MLRQTDRQTDKQTDGAKRPPHADRATLALNQQYTYQYNVHSYSTTLRCASLRVNDNDNDITSMTKVISSW